MPLLTGYIRLAFNILYYAYIIKSLCLLTEHTFLFILSNINFVVLLYRLI